MFSFFFFFYIFCSIQSQNGLFFSRSDLLFHHHHRSPGAAAAVPPAWGFAQVGCRDVLSSHPLTIEADGTATIQVPVVEAWTPAQTAPLRPVSNPRRGGV